MILKKKKKNKIHEVKYYRLYNYQSALEAIASNFFPFINDNPTSIIVSNNFSISVIKQICIRSFSPPGENPYLIILTSTLFSNGKFNEIPFTSSI